MTHLTQGIASNSHNVAIIAGHYCVAPNLDDLSHNSQAEEMSFRKGAELYLQVREQGKLASLYLWVNDIGISADERALLKQSYRVPENYLAIASEYDIAESAIQVLFESAARNKASTLLRQIHKNHPSRFRQYDSGESGLMRCVEGVVCEISDSKKAYVIDGPEGENLVVKEGPNPKCNLILATLFMLVQKAQGCDAIVNIFNSIYTNRIRLGIYVFIELFTEESSLVFENYFCDDLRVIQKNFDF